MAYDKKNRRDANKIQYLAPESPGKTEGEKMKEFIVSAKTAITDNDGVKCYPGDKIMLTEKQANYFANLGYLQLDLNFNDENEEEIAKLRSELAELKRTEATSALEGGAGDSAIDAGQAGEKPAIDASGAESGDGDIPAGDTQAAGDAPRNRRKVNL